MTKTFLKMQTTEAVVTAAAAQIFAAYVGSGKLSKVGSEEEAMDKAVDLAVQIAGRVIEKVQTDTELRLT